jgi:hypothetical protein
MIARDLAASPARQLSSFCDGCQLEHVGTWSPPGWYVTDEQDHLCAYCLAEAVRCYVAQDWHPHDDELLRVAAAVIREEAP